MTTRVEFPPSEGKRTAANDPLAVIAASLALPLVQERIIDAEQKLVSDEPSLAALYERRLALQTIVYGEDNSGDGGR